ncbi:DinB family protein [Virgibacillus oceani]|uniref:DinB-like domain-containing protein n=1 Tax=Virgibacillus oceani TaxID=1479511 RepID=A0A917HH73_9BACI|nr:DinB family protein [Virgibacillus oceani]GGG78485.1 hypothetical protein GCM10011398_24670 [Virgibacillus oceani]
MNLGLTDIFRMEYDFCWDKETWFVPLESALRGLNSADASWQPPGGGNTIWQTVNHLNYYNTVLLRQINDDPSPGKRASNHMVAFGDIGEPVSEKWKTILAEDTFGDGGDQANSDKWEEVVAEARMICEELRKSLAQVHDSQLDEELAGGLARQILHNVYHIGQIVLIRKQQGSWPKERA